MEAVVEEVCSTVGQQRVLLHLLEADAAAKFCPFIGWRVSAFTGPVDRTCPSATMLP